MANSLPPGFADLEPFVARFAIAGTANRAGLRSAATPDERTAFYAAAKDRIGPALDYLDSRPLEALDAAEERLMNLALAFAHIALGIEIQGPDEARHAALREHMKIVRSTADRVSAP